MRKKGIELGYHIPIELKEMLKNHYWEKVNIGCSKSDIYRLENEDGLILYLKISIPKTEFNFNREQKLLNWLSGKLPIPEVLFYSKFNNREFLLLSEIKGRVSYDAVLDEEIRNNILILAEGLKKIHSIEIDECPLNSHPDVFLDIAKSRLDQDLVDSKNFDPRWKDKTPAELYEIVKERKPSKYDLVFSHGDYCLPNVLVHNKKLSGFIDWCYGGINDRNFDIAAVVWSIGYNFGEEWVPLFLKEYGDDKIDWNKINYFQMLNSFID